MTNTNPFTAFASFDPMGYFAASQQHVAQLESQWVARAQQAVAMMAQLAQDAIAYTAQLSAEARKLVVVPAATPAAKA